MEDDRNNDKSDLSSQGNDQCVSVLGFDLPVDMVLIIIRKFSSDTRMLVMIPKISRAWKSLAVSEEIFLSFNLRILRRHGTGTSISRATAGRPRYLI